MKSKIISRVPVLLNCFLFNAALMIKSSFSQQLKFSYNPDSEIGPEQWYKIDASKSEYRKYFSVESNICNNKRQQSPVNLRPLEKCYDDHNIRTQRGKNDFETIHFSILPHGLRANLVKEKGAKANFSNLSKRVSAVQVEIKVPSEHYLFSQQYPGELVITHDWDKKGKIINVSVMLDDSKDKHNLQLEHFIKEWEEVFWERENDCDGFQYRRFYRRPTEAEMNDVWGAPKRNKGANYDLYKLLPTLWYCGYVGSITVPPCTDSVVWRVLDLPLILSKSQLKRIQGLILDQKDESCKKVEVSYNGKVNRPIQTSDIKPKIWCCTSDNWGFKRVKDEAPEWLERQMDWPRDYHGSRGFNPPV